jgi:hypothetical protein
MAIEERYEAEGSNQIFDNPIDAVKEAMFISQISKGKAVKVYRSVKYTGQDHFKKYTLNTVQVPTDSNITIDEDNPLTRPWRK